MLILLPRNHSVEPNTLQLDKSQSAQPWGQEDEDIVPVLSGFMFFLERQFVTLYITLLEGTVSNRDIKFWKNRDRE